MKIRITDLAGKIVFEGEERSHAAAIKKFNVNKMKKSTARFYDFVVDNLDGLPSRTYWVFED